MADVDWIIDASERPLVRIRFPESPTSASIRAYAEALHGHYRQGALAAVCDLRRMNAARVNARLRQQFNEALSEVLAQWKERCIGEAIVSPSPMLRGLYTAYRWTLSRYPFPSKAFELEADAETWARLLIEDWRDAGHPLT